MLLDEYREYLVGRLKSCGHNGAVRLLLAEADQVLLSAQLALPAQARFWDSLDEDLTAIAHAALWGADREAGMKLPAIVAVARARIARYREARRSSIAPAVNRE